MLRIEYSPKAEKQMKKLSKPLQRKVSYALARFIAGEHVDIKKLTNSDNSYRIRISDYRIVFDLILSGNLVYVTKIAHRRDVYRGL